MPTVSELLSALGSAAPWDKAAGWDPTGLQLGDPNAPVSRVAVCHEVTEAVAGVLEEDPPDLVVTYHPLLFRPVTRLLAGRGPAGRAIRLLRAGVALAVAHTSFDVAPGGTADALADALGLSQVEPFSPVGGPEMVKVVTFVPEEAVEAVAAAMAAAGGGRIGNYRACSFRAEGTGAFLPVEGSKPTLGQVGRPSREPEVRLEMVAPRIREGAVVAALAAAHPYEEPAWDVYDTRSNQGFVGRVGRVPRGTLADLAARVGEVLGAEGMRVSGDRETVVERVAVVPGAGAGMIADAAGEGADCLVTGDVSHHQVVEALDRGMAVIDPGHAPTERPGMAPLVEAVRRAAADALVIDLTHLDPAPWR